MLNPSDISGFAPSLADLAALPTAEDARFEYKSSKTPDKELARKLQNAASAFWNSGGGLFVAGVNNAGDPDGGIAPEVGREPRLDWVDRVLSEVSPRGQVTRLSLSGSPTRGTLDDERTILVVAFQESHIAPHMSADGRYYVRAGAHTEFATHFIVEAIRSRRGIGAPQLTALLRPTESRIGFAELVVPNLTDIPAYRVEVEIDPSPPLLQQTTGTGSRTFPAVDRSYPGIVPFTFIAQSPPRWHEGDKTYCVHITYHDALERSYTSTVDVTPDAQLPKANRDASSLDRIAMTLAEIKFELGALKSIGASRPFGR